MGHHYNRGSSLNAKFVGSVAYVAEINFPFFHCLNNLQAIGIFKQLRLKPFSFKISHFDCRNHRAKAAIIGHIGHTNHLWFPNAASLSAFCRLLAGFLHLIVNAGNCKCPFAYRGGISDNIFKMGDNTFRRGTIAA